jgi:hypothetical protein
MNTQLQATVEAEYTVIGLLLIDAGASLLLV